MDCAMASAKGLTRFRSGRVLLPLLLIGIVGCGRFPDPPAEGVQIQKAVLTLPDGRQRDITTAMPSSAFSSWVGSFEKERFSRSRTMLPVYRADRLDDGTWEATVSAEIGNALGSRAVCLRFSERCIKVLGSLTREMGTPLGVDVWANVDIPAVVVRDRRLTDTASRAAEVCSLSTRSVAQSGLPAPPILVANRGDVFLCHAPVERRSNAPRGSTSAWRVGGLLTGSGGFQPCGASMDDALTQVDPTVVACVVASKERSQKKYFVLSGPAGAKVPEAYDGVLDVSVRLWKAGTEVARSRFRRSPPSSWTYITPIVEYPEDEVVRWLRSLPQRR